MSSIVHCKLLPCQWRSRGPFFTSVGGSCVYCQRRIRCWSKVADLNWSISPSDFINWATFLANSRQVSISSQHILPNAALLLSPFHVSFFFPVYIQHCTRKCFADCIHCLQEYSDESKPGTFCECKNFLRPIFFVLI